MTAVEKPCASVASLPWSQIRLVVFDVDGTLYDQRPLRRRMLLVLLRHCLVHPHDLSLLRTLKTFRRLREEMAEQASDDIGRLQYERPAALLGSSPETVRQTVEAWMHERPLRYLRGCRYPAVERVFEALKSSGRTTAIFSDYPAAAKLRALGLRADLQVAATDPDVQRLKPHPLGLHRVLERTGIPAEACLYIGDRDERDGACARRLGVHYLLKTHVAEQRPPWTFDHYEALLPWIATAAADAAPSRVAPLA